MPASYGVQRDLLNLLSIVIKRQVCDVIYERRILPVNKFLLVDFKGIQKDLIKKTH